MKKSTFYHVLETALAWDRVGSEVMGYPEVGENKCFQTEEELALFENFLILLNDIDMLDTLGFIASFKSQEENAPCDTQI